jgi:hypothetical protein
MLTKTRKKGYVVVALCLAIILVVSSCSPSSAVKTIIYTPRGTVVNALQVTCERAQGERTDADNAVRNYHPNAVIIQNSTQYYNCHSYAWHFASVSSDIWLDSPEQSKYWNDGSYAYVTQQNHTANGVIPSAAAVEHYRVRYVNDDHSARVSSTANKYWGKWGWGPRVRHSPNDSPYNNSLMYYYKR